MAERIFIIAEAGVNHNGSIETAKKLIDAAKEAGADAVKFQTFSAEKLTAETAPKAEYQKQNSDKNESQFTMLKKLELDKSGHIELMKYCNNTGILFMSSPFDLDAVDFLNSIGLEIFKIPSGEITNLQYLRKIGSLGKKVILSTGMATLSEILDALIVLTNLGTKKENITILHCSTEYPAPFEEVNLKAMIEIEKVTGCKTGYSDHTTGIIVPIAAASIGAKIIEKHFTLDKNMPGPDHKASLLPHELKEMVEAIRIVEKIKGDGHKRPTASELKNRDIARKSIVAAKNILAGEIFSSENLTVKRPGTGISPMLWDEIIGKKAIKNYKKDELIENHLLSSSSSSSK